MKLTCGQLESCYLRYLLDFLFGFPLKVKFLQKEALFLGMVILELQVETKEKFLRNRQRLAKS